MVTNQQLETYRKELNLNATQYELTLIGRLRSAKIRVRQQVIIPPFIVDILIPKKMLIVEVDGLIHDTKQDYDFRRTAYLTDLGFQVFRVKNSEVRDPRILAAIQSYPDVDGRKCKRAKKIIANLVAQREKWKPRPPQIPIDKQPKPTYFKCSCGTKTILYQGALGPHRKAGKGELCPYGTNNA